MLSSSVDFINRLSCINLPSNYSMVSFDVVSLFTCIPLEEVIELACRYVYGDNSVSKPKYDVRHFRKLLQFATSGEFLYRDKLYRQVDGVSMGSPIAPTLANLFLAKLESDWLKAEGAPNIYLRYVDDIFCIFDSTKNSHQGFLDYLNRQHSNLKFTCEVGPRSLPFLDVNVQTNNANSVFFSVFRKDTYTGLLLNARAFCPLSWKKALIVCFLKRAITLCSNWTLFHDEVSNLRSIFRRNGYTCEIFDRVLKSFLVKYVSNSHSTDISREPDTYTLVLPYTGECSDQFRFRFIRFIKRHNLNCLLTFTPSKVSNYFSLKSSVPDILKSCLVYKYVCPVEPGHVYIGKTKRHFSTRIREHCTTNTAVRAHCDICHCFSPNNFSVIRTCNTDYETTLAEALLIRKNSPTLNNTLANNGSCTLLQL